MRMEEIFGEQAVAKPGHYNDTGYLFNICFPVFTQYWEVIDTLNLETLEYSIAKHKSSPTWVVGNLKTFDTPHELGKKEFEVVFKIDLHDSSDIGKLLGYDNLYQVNLVMVRLREWGNKIAKHMYRYLVKNQGITLLGDRYQYFGARKLWASLSKNMDIQVDIVNLKTHEILYPNVTLHHDQYDHDFDSRLWSYGHDKEHIRSILVNI